MTESLTHGGDAPDQADPPVALVTGATSGIGQGVASELIRRGWHVVSASRRGSSEALLGSLHVPTDVADSESVRDLVAVIARTYGRLDLVVNNSGTGPQIPHADLDGATPALWDEILGVNLLGPWHIISASRPLLVASDRAHVVNVTSLAGFSARGSSIPYSVSKAGLGHLTRLLAKALSPQVRVNSIAPGWIDSPRNADWPGREDVRDHQVPLRRLGQPSDIADAVIALDHMTYVTGEIICVDGGMHLG